MTLNGQSLMPSMIASRISRWISVTTAILGICGCFPLLGPTLYAKKGTPAGKIYVSELEGGADIDTGERIREMTRKAVYDADLSIIRTKAGSTNTIVFSNGIGVFLDADTTLRVEQFVQEPFQPNRSDLELEPSISRMILDLRNGTIALCTSRLLPGSSLELRTPHAVVTIRGKRVIVQTSETGTTISLIEGDLTARAGRSDDSGQTLVAGQRAVIRQGRLEDRFVLLIEAIPEMARRPLEDKAAYACIARQTVYFDMDEAEPGALLRGRSGASVFDSSEDSPDDAVIRPVPAVPTIPEVPTFVSPAEIQNPNPSANPT